MNRFTTTAKRAVRKAERTLGRDYVDYEGAKLPPPGMRYCGASFRDDATFLESSDFEADRLIRDLGITPDSRILEIGAGPGRMPIGLIRKLGDVASYHGIDIDETAMSWCTRHITKEHPTYQFHWIDAQHDRYRPEGRVMDDDFRLPVPSNFFDLVYLHSVIANLVDRDARVYARIFADVLRPGGRVFLTAFVEEDVPPVTVNPSDYVVESSGPLNVVRYERDFMVTMFQEAGFELELFDHAAELDAQSALIFRLP